MKIDLSTVLLIVLVLSPGLFAIKSRSLIVPRSLQPKGSGEELAELVSLSLLTHGTLGLTAAVLLGFFGAVRHSDLAFFFRQLDRMNLLALFYAHQSEALLLGVLYVFVAFLTSHLLGLVYGAVEMNGGVTARLLKDSWFSRRFKVRGVLGDAPLLYDLLVAEVDSAGLEKYVFLEAEMKGGLGFYSGQLSEFAIVRDEENHRPLYMTEVFFRTSREVAYLAMEHDGIFIDLADVFVLHIKQLTLNDLNSLSPKASPPEVS